MPLESCMILLDNSQYMLNGDYIPTRLSAQTDAANLLVTHKTQSNPESTVGVIAMSGGIHSSSSGGNDNAADGVELLVSPTDDMGKILHALHDIPIRGRGDTSHSGVDIAASVQVASLALKHRRNKNGQQRIVIFVGSPLTHVNKKALVKAGKMLKKNNVAIDVVAIGELEENEGKLKDLVDAANGSSNSGSSGEEKLCHLVTIPTGVLPSDVLVGSPIVHGGSGGGVGGGMGGGMDAGMGGGGGAMDGFAEFGGVDPNMDPELAMALRVSMEEERARQERLAREQAAAEADGGDGGGENQDSNATSNEATTSSGGGDMDVDTNAQAVPPETAMGAAVGMMDDMGDEDALLQQALAMSMMDNQPSPEPTSEEKGESKPSATEAGGSTMDTDDLDDEDAAMQMALRMSMQDAESNANATESSSEQQQEQQQFQDPQFVNQLLGSLPGVDPNDPEIRNALENLNKSNQQKDDGDKKDSKDDSEKK